MTDGKPGLTFNIGHFTIHTGSEERGVLGVGSIPVALLPTGSKEKEVLGVGSIPVVICPLYCAHRLDTDRLVKNDIFGRSE